MVGVSAQNFSAWLTGILLPRWIERAPALCRVKAASKA
jgi:hypothetical protein